MDEQIFREIILERYKNPQNRGIVNGGKKAAQVNYNCGDKLSLTARIEKGVIVEVKFEGGGCAVSMAAVDMLCDKLKGMKIDEAQKLRESDIEEMLGVELSLSRKKCANLGLETVKKIFSG